MRMGIFGRLFALLVVTGSLMFGGVLNGGFETGDLTSWTVLGTAEASSGNDYPPQVNPFGGTFAARITSGALAVDDLEIALGLAPGDLESVAESGSPTVGSVIVQTGVTVIAGQVLTFRWNYLSEESEEFNDYSFFGFALSGGASQVFRLSSAAELPALEPEDDYKTSGWQTVTFQFTQSGTYALFFGSLDVDDELFPSDLWIDNVGLNGETAIPEPSALLLSGLGLLGFWVVRKRYPVGVR